jgi:DNA mismatch repair protein MutL
MPRIQRLPPAVVNQIAAGEVIERPASVVKELLENSLDAGATRVEITIEQAGRDLIRIWDNGCGIAADELPLAVASHATSKLATADDLFRVMTFGFRGEALASIASISHMRLQSRPAGSDGGAQIEAAGGEVGPVVACGCPPGTAIEIRNLFFNTPVRRRFLKATQTEMGHIVEAFTRVAIAQPGLAMVLRHNDKTVFDLPASHQLVERLTLFFGHELAEKLIWVESELGGSRLSGYVADPSQTRSSPRTQYLFVNGRYIRDRSLGHALTEAYRGLLMVGRHPVAFLFWQIPCEDVDVNVHPTKIEVRFRDSQQHYRQLLATLRQKFLTTDLRARLHAPSTPNDADGERAAAFQSHESLADFLNRAPDQSDPSNSPPRQPDSPATFALRAPAPPLVTPALPFPGTSPHSPTHLAAEPAGLSSLPHVPGPPSAPARPVATAPTLSAPSGEPLSDHAPAIQVHNSYLVVETPDGLMLIDQHALHERVLYEELRTRVLAGQLESQRLLVPEIVELSAAEAATVTDHSDVLEQLGMRVESFGGTSVALHTYPAMLANLPADRLFRDVVDQLSAGTHAPSRRDLLDSLLHMISCKAAIKAGQRLTPEEIDSLVAQQHLAHDSHHCPHGRPTALVFTKNDLERQFKRV